MPDSAGKRRLNPASDFEALGGRRQQSTEHDPSADNEHRHNDRGTDRKPEQAAGLKADAMQQRGRDDQRNRGGVGGGQQRAEPAVQQTRHREQPEQVGWQMKQIEQERDRRVHAAEQREDTCRGHRAPLRQRQVVAAKPRGKRNEPQAQDFAGMREIEHQRHDHTNRRVAVCLRDPLLPQQFLAFFRDDRQHDEQIAGGEGGQERSAEAPREALGGNRRDQADE